MDNRNPFAFTPEQIMVRDMVRKWAQTVLRKETPALERNEKPPYDLIRDFAKTFGVVDLARAAVEKQLSKSGAGKEAEQSSDDAVRSSKSGTDPTLQAIVAMELSRENPGFVMAMGASTGLAGGAILAKGTPEQKRRFALPIVTLEKIGAWGMTEPGAGSDAFSGMRTVARKQGADYVLSGQKTFITNAPYADTFVIYAKLDRGGDTPAAARPIHAFVLDKGMAGLSVGPVMHKMGMHSSPTGEIFLDEVRVGIDRLLGETEESTSREGARDVFHGERTGMIPMCLGILDRCLEDTLAYAKQRTVWGQPLAEYQLVQDKIARMYTARENMQNLLFKSLWMTRNGERMSMADASVCKLYCARETTQAALDAIQILGGNGYMREYHVEQLMRDAKLLQIGGGADEIQIVTIARALFRQSGA